MQYFRCMLLWLLFLATATISARSIPTINAEKAHEAARQQVKTYKGLSAVQVVYGWHLRPDVWKDEPMIRITDSNLRQQLGIDGEYARFSELFDDTLGYRLNTLGADLPERMRQLVRESSAVVELDEKVGMIILLTQGKLIQPRPDTMKPQAKKAALVIRSFSSSGGYALQVAGKSPRS